MKNITNEKCAGCSGVCMKSLNIISRVDETRLQTIISSAIRKKKRKNSNEHNRSYTDKNPAVIGKHTECNSGVFCIFEIKNVFNYRNFTFCKCFCGPVLYNLINCNKNNRNYCGNKLKHYSSKKFTGRTAKGFRPYYIFIYPTISAQRAQRVGCSGFWPTVWL
jgi:hypothetical protein